MNAKKQIKFEVTIGTNSDEISEQMMTQKALDTELLFNNTNPLMRMHISYVEEKETK